MPKTLTPTLLNHYQQSLTRCIRIERRDGVVIALTDHDSDLTIDKTTYQSAIGYTPTAISTHDQAAVNTAEYAAQYAPFLATIEQVLGREAVNALLKLKQPKQAA